MPLLCYVSTVLTIAVCTVHGADEAIMKIRSDSASTYILTLAYSTDMLQKFSNCVCEGMNTNCIMKYDYASLPNSQFLNLSSSGTWSDAGSSCKYYKCKVDQSQGEVLCEQQNPTNYLCSNNPLHQVVSIFNQFSCTATCVIFIWTHRSEGLNNTSGFSSIQKCDNDCLCPATTTAATMTNTNLISRMTSHEITVTFGDKTSTHNRHIKISSSSLVSTTVKVNTSEDQNNDFSAAIIGSVIGVIVIVVIIIVVVIVWRRRKQMSNPPKPLQHYVNVRDTNEMPNNSDTDVKKQQNAPRNLLAGSTPESSMNQDTRGKAIDKNNYLNGHIISRVAGQREHINSDEQKAGLSGAVTSDLTTKTSPTSETTTTQNGNIPPEATDNIPKEYFNQINEITNMRKDKKLHIIKAKGEKDKAARHDPGYDYFEIDYDKADRYSNTTLGTSHSGNGNGTTNADIKSEASVNDYDYIENDQSKSINGANDKFKTESDFDYSECRDVSSIANNDTSLQREHLQINEQKNAAGKLIRETRDNDSGYELCKIDSLNDDNVGEELAEDGYNTASDVASFNNSKLKSKNTGDIISLNNSILKSKNVYSRLGDEARNITNPYDLAPENEEYRGEIHEQNSPTTLNKQSAYSSAGTCFDDEHQVGHDKKTTQDTSNPNGAKKLVPTYSFVRKVRSSNPAPSQGNVQTNTHSEDPELAAASADNEERCEYFTGVKKKQGIYFELGRDEDIYSQSSSDVKETNT